MFSRFHEYVFDFKGALQEVDGLCPAEAARGDMPPMAGLPLHLLSDILANVSLSRLMELAVEPNLLQAEAQRILRRTRVTNIMLTVEDSGQCIRVDTRFFGKGSECVDYCAHTRGLLTHSWIDAFNHVFEIFLCTNVSDASLTFHLAGFFPEPLQTAHLKARSRANALIAVHDLQWGYGGPLELFVQLWPTRQLIDGSYVPQLDAPADIARTILENNIIPH